MKTLTIEQVENGYIVSNKPERGGCEAIYDEAEHGIHVFETFASMSKWLEGHFARDPEAPAPYVVGARTPTPADGCRGF